MLDVNALFTARSFARAFRDGGPWTLDLGHWILDLGLPNAASLE
jgi:hypothetical protein